MLPFSVHQISPLTTVINEERAGEVEREFPCISSSSELCVQRRLCSSVTVELLEEFFFYYPVFSFEFGI